LGGSATRHQLGELKDVVAKSQVEAQVARERVVTLELEAKNVRTYHDKVEDAT
jgi:hypothetical protein